MYVLKAQCKSMLHCFRDMILCCLPNDWLTNRFWRPNILKLMGMRIGSGSTISKALFCGSLKNIEVGSNILINSQAFFHAGGKIIIGDNVTIGHGAVVHGCTIEENCIIGIRSVILNGANEIY